MNINVSWWASRMIIYLWVYVFDPEKCTQWLKTKEPWCKRTLLNTQLFLNAVIVYCDFKSRQNQLI